MTTRSLFLMLLLFTTSVMAAPTLRNLSGQKVALDQLHGQWIFINYWASWCGPCLQEIPELNRFARQNAAKAKVFAVNYDGVSVKNQLQLSQKYLIEYTSLQTNSAKSLGLGQIVAVPTTFVLNPKGELVTTLLGPQTAGALERYLS